MEKKLNHFIQLSLGLLLLVLHFLSVMCELVETVRNSPFWNFLIYTYVVLYVICLFFFCCLFSRDKWCWKSENNLERNKAIFFMVIILLSGLYYEFGDLVQAYYGFRGGICWWKAMLNLGFFTYFLILICCVFGVLIPRNMGYVLCLQIPLYLIGMFFRVAHWYFFWNRMRYNWIFYLIFVIVWCILCHRRVMLEHWKIRTRKELAICFSISLVIGFLSYYFRW